MQGAYFSPENAERIARTVRGWEAGPGGIVQPPALLADRDFNRVPFRNDYAGTIPAYGVCRVGEPVAFDGVWVYPANRPDATFRRRYLVNGPDDVADDGYGWGTWLWHADWVLYDDTNTPAVDESWGPQDGSFELKKWRYGFTISGLASGGSTDLVLAQQEWVNQILCKSNEAFSADGDTGAISVYDGNQADITGTDISGCINRTGVAWANDDWGTATWLGGNWFVEPWECSA